MVVVEGARERVVGGSAPLVTLLLTGAWETSAAACYLRPCQARRLADELLAAAVALGEHGS